MEGQVDGLSLLLESHDCQISHKETSWQMLVTLNDCLPFDLRYRRQVNSFHCHPDSAAVPTQTQ